VAGRPATQYVAGLVGLNLYAGRRGAGGAVSLDSGGTVIARDSDPAGLPGERVLVAVPPGAIALHLDRPGPGSPRNVWPGTVRSFELLADRVRVRVQGAPSALVDITPAALADLALAGGTAVWLSAKAGEVACYPDAGSAEPGGAEPAGPGPHGEPAEFG
jgi:molybdate transport system ATP-binding protein